MQKRDSLLRAIVCITNFTLWLVTQPFPDNLRGGGGGGRLRDNFKERWSRRKRKKEKTPRNKNKTKVYWFSLVNPKYRHILVALVYNYAPSSLTYTGYSDTFLFFSNAYSFDISAL